MLATCKRVCVIHIEIFFPSSPGQTKVIWHLLLFIFVNLIVPTLTWASL